MNNVITATNISPKETLDVYIVMHRFGSKDWFVSSTWLTLEDAEKSKLYALNERVNASQIVLVSGLSIKEI